MRRGEEREPIAIVTRHNVGQLPDQDSLVRSSDLPEEPSRELLRIVAQDQETRTEQLLRSTPEGNR
jgi:hypothetical protein